MAQRRLGPGFGRLRAKGKGRGKRNLSFAWWNR